MTPKKAIIILLVLFLVMAIIFVVLYMNKPAVDQPVGQPVGNGDNLTASSTGQDKLSPPQQQIQALEVKTNQQVQQIMEQGKTASGGITVDAGNKIIEVQTQELIEKLKLRTPEQIKADQQRKAELEKMQQQEILQVKSQLQKK